MRACGGIPRQLFPRSPGTGASPLEGSGVGEQLVDGGGQAGDVARGDHATRIEALDRLGDPADVIGDGRDARSERTQQRPALVELGPVREDGDRRSAERTVALLRRQVPEPPLHVETVRRRPVRLERLERVARDEQPCVSGLADRLDRVSEPLVRADHPEGEDGPAVVRPLRLAREDGVGDDAEPRPVDSEPGERLPAVLAVHDDPLEPREEPAPELGAVRGAAGEKIVRGEDRRKVRTEEKRVEFGRGKPLHVEHVRLHASESRKPERVLRSFERQAQARAAEEARRERVEQLTAAVSVRLRCLAEAKAGGHELDVRARPCECRRQLVVVRRREGRRIGEQYTHGSVRYAVAMFVRTWNLFHGNASPPERRAYLRTMIELVTDGPDVVCLQELPVWALSRLERWSGMHATGAVARKPLLPFGARAVTDLHHGLLRSAVTGEADAILTRKPARNLGARVMGQTKLRRIAHAVFLEGITIVNFHIDGRREQFDRVLGLAGERSIVAGDANLVAPVAEGFSPPLGGSIDQILVRGLDLVDGPAAWPLERRVVDGRVLSDHAPVEAVIE